MQVSVSHQYPIHAEALYQFLLCPDNITAKNNELDVENLNIDHSLFNDGKGSIKISRNIGPNIEIPKALKSFQKAKHRVHQTENWHSADGHFHCEYTVEIESVPATLKGTMHIEPINNESVIHVNLHIECKIPLVGKLIREFIAKDSASQMEKEYQVNKKLLLNP